MTTFLFVHGASHGAWCWDEVMKLVEKDPRVRGAIAIDLVGHGARLKEKPAEAITLDDYIADIARAVRETRTQDIVLVGHSMAGASMPQAAAQVATQVKGLVFVAALIPNEGTTVRQNVATRPEEPTRTAQELYRAIFCNDMDAETADRLLARLTTEPQGPMEEIVRRPPLPPSLRRAYVLLTQDRAVIPERQRLFAANIGAQETVEIEAGHDVMVSKPQALAQALLRFA